MNYEIAVIGSGSAGKEAALLAAKEGRRVVLIEKETLGGTCYHRSYFAIRILRACCRFQLIRRLATDDFSSESTI